MAKNGLVHFKDGSMAYYQNDRLHRTDGPAAQLADGTQIYALDGRHAKAPRNEKDANISFKVGQKVTFPSGDKGVVIKIEGKAGLIKLDKDPSKNFRFFPWELTGDSPESTFTSAEKELDTASDREKDYAADVSTSADLKYR